MAEDEGPRFGFDEATARSLGQSFGELSAAFLVGTPTIDQFLGLVETASGPLRGLTGLFRQVSGFLEGQLTLYQQLTRSGVNFGGQFDQMGIAAISARMSLERLAEITQANSQTIAGFGESADNGMQQFLRRSATFMDTEYATGLRRLGMTFDDINDSMMQYESILAMTGHTNAMTDAQRNRAAFDFSLELDKLSKLTGKQAEQIADEMRERAREGDYRAFLMGLSPDQVAAVQAEQQAADAAGFGDLFKDMMVRGVASTRETRLQSAMMGGTTQSLAAMRGQLLSGDIQGFRQSGSDTRGIAFGEMSSEVFRATAMLSPFSEAGAAAAGALGSMEDATFRLASAFRDESERLGRDLTATERAEISARIDAGIASEQRAQMQTPTDPTDTRNIMNALIGTQDLILRTAEEVQVQATERLYEALAGEVQGFTESLNGFDSDIFVDRIVSGFDDFFERVGLGGSGAPLPSNREIDRIINEARDLGDTNAQAAALRAREIAEELLDPGLSPADRVGLEDQLATLLDSIDDVTMVGGQVTIIGPENVNVGPGRATGSIGMTGNILEDFGRGSLAVLHGRESVLTEGQLTTLASNLITIGRSQNIGGSLQGLVNTIAPQMQQMAMSMQSNSVPQMQGLANEMLPMLEQMATQMQGPMREMAEQMRGPMEQMAGTMTRQLGMSRRSLRALQGAGNMFRGLSA